MDERNIFAPWPKDALAISGKLLICFRIRFTSPIGKSEDAAFVESSEKNDTGLGSPFNSRPKSIVVRHAITNKRILYVVFL